MTSLIVDILVWWMILDAILSYFDFYPNQMMYMFKKIVSNVQVLYIPIRKIIKPRNVDLSPLILILGLQLLERFITAL